MRRTILLSVAAISLAACNTTEAHLSWMSVPEDPEVYAYLVKECLTSARGPQSTKYNDWDEAIHACGQIASNAARYCPVGAKCDPGINSRADVRQVLKGINRE